MRTGRLARLRCFQSRACSSPCRRRQPFLPLQVLQHRLLRLQSMQRRTNLVLHLSVLESRRQPSPDSSAYLVDIRLPRPTRWGRLQQIRGQLKHPRPEGPRSLQTIQYRAGIAEKLAHGVEQTIVCMIWHWQADHDGESIHQTQERLRHGNRRASWTSKKTLQESPKLHEMLRPELADGGGRGLQAGPQLLMVGLHHAQPEHLRGDCLQRVHILGRLLHHLHMGGSLASARAGLHREPIRRPRRWRCRHIIGGLLNSQCLRQTGQELTLVGVQVGSA
mmetsp:Transcript_24996/g.63801  ORF Transcript_24996/g.63801 Transcript_24996/m.63801 type:complete len:277 (+) Transcript_24996:1650-2480(+)